MVLGAFDLVSATHLNTVLLDMIHLQGNSRPLASFAGKVGIASQLAFGIGINFACPHGLAPAVVITVSFVGTAAVAVAFGGDNLGSRVLLGVWLVAQAGCTTCHIFVNCNHRQTNTENVVLMNTIDSTLKPANQLISQALKNITTL